MFFIQCILATWYIALFGMRFYKRDIPEDIEKCKHLMIKTIYDYDITFYYREEDIKFTHYRFFCKYRHHYKVHNIYVGMSDSAPEPLKKIDNVISLVVSPIWFYWFDEKVIIDKMIYIYTSHLIKIMKKQK